MSKNQNPKSIIKTSDVKFLEHLQIEKIKRAKPRKKESVKVDPERERNDNNPIVFL